MNTQRWYGTWAVVQWACVMAMFIAAPFGRYSDQPAALTEGILALAVTSAAMNSHLYFKGRYPANRHANGKPW